MGAFDELESLLSKIKNRLRLTEKIGLLFLIPLDDEHNLDSKDVKKYVVESDLWDHYASDTYHFKSKGKYDPDPIEVEMDWDELQWNHDDELKLLLLHIAACEGRRPEKLYDEIWPNKRDVVTRLADVAE